MTLYRPFKGEGGKKKQEEAQRRNSRRTSLSSKLVQVGDSWISDYSPTFFLLLVHSFVCECLCCTITTQHTYSNSTPFAGRIWAATASTKKGNRFYRIQRTALITLVRPHVLHPVELLTETKNRGGVIIYIYINYTSNYFPW